jgi:hypothetical protein
VPNTNASPYASTGMVMVAGQTLSNVVAIAAGNYHSLALRADGTVVGWGQSDYGQATGLTNSIYPYASTGLVRVAGQILSNVVAIAAGDYHSLALRGDGTVIGWGDNRHNQITIPSGVTNVIAIAGGGDHSVFLKVTHTGGPVGNGNSFIVRAQIPLRVGNLLQEANSLVLTNLDLDLHDAAIELCGSKALFQAVLELAMPYTLERDDVLHGFLYGSESLVDLEATRYFLNGENDRFNARPDAKPQTLSEVAELRFRRFADRLDARLDDIAATGQPELPRLVEHSMRLLSLLRDAWASVPPPALEIGRETNACQLVLHGEPYAHYTLQYRDSLSVPGWANTTITNWHNEQIISPVSGGSQRFYRGLLPAP